MMMRHTDLLAAEHTLAWTATGATLLGGVIAGAALLLWWVADHRRGLRWAQSVIRRRFPEVAQISAGDLAAWLADANREPPLLWDVRSKEEYEVSHLPRAENVPVETEDEELRHNVECAEGKVIVCYCSAGYRGAEMARRLRKLGVKDACNLSGGVFHWANESLEMKRGTDPATRVHPYHPFFRRLLKPERRSERR